MPSTAQKSVPSKGRRFWRWCRIAISFSALILLSGFLYLNQVGLPAFLKQRLQAALYERGLNARFEHLWLDWQGRIAAESVNLTGVSQAKGSEFFFKHIFIEWDPSAFARGRLKVHSLQLIGGRLTAIVPHSNAPPASLSLRDLNLSLQFLPGDQWQVDELKGIWEQSQFRVSGTVTNASHLRALSLKPAAGAAPLVWTTRLRHILRANEHFRFPGAPPNLEFTFRADARQLAHSRFQLKLTVPSAQTPWLNLEHLVLIARSWPADHAMGAEVRAWAARTWGRWGQAQDAQLRYELELRNGSLFKAAGELNLRNARTPLIRADTLDLRSATTASDPTGLGTELNARGTGVQCTFGQAAGADLNAILRHSPTDWIPSEGQWGLALQRIESDWGQAPEVQFSGRLARRPKDRMVSVDQSWSWWAGLEPFDLDWKVELAQLQSPKLAIDRLLCRGQWRPPWLEVQELSAQLYRGAVQASADLQIPKRELNSRVSFNFDVHQLMPLLATNSQRWLRQFQWSTPPEVQASLRLVLPAWTNWQSNWRKEARPTLWMNGAFKTEAAVYRDIPVLSARSHFVYSNDFWQLPDLQVNRVEGSLDLAVEENSRTRAYQVKIRGRADPKILRSFIGDTGDRILDQFQFAEPASVEGMVWGPWYRHEGGLSLEYAVTNFTFRGEALDACKAKLFFTNDFVSVVEGLILREEREIAIPGLGYHFRDKQLFVTNVLSAIDPLLVAKLIDPDMSGRLAPYQFDQPPTIRLNGSTLTTNQSLTDLRFEIKGGPFRYWKFKMPYISGTLHWRTNSLTLSDVQGQFYEGQLKGDAHFDFLAPAGADFRLDGAAERVDWHLLMVDLVSPATSLEGILNGRLTVSRANTADPRSWHGLGQVRLQDGFIWEIPVFSVLSPVLNSISPGLGNSRAREGAATFTITNSVVHTSDLEIRSPPVRLQYTGTIDFQGEVDARVEALLFKDTWMVGPVFSLAFLPLTKIFEYHVTGTLSEPIAEPVYIPRLLLFPFRPLRTLKEILPAEPPKPQ